MTMPIKKMTLAAALKDYFAKDTPAGAFLKEFKALTDEDKAYFRKHMPSVGYEIIHAADVAA